MGRSTPMDTSLADDEARLNDIAQNLHGAIDGVFDRWITTLILDRVPSGNRKASELAASAAAAARAAVMPRLELLLRTDIDEQRGSPLALLRGAVLWPNQALTDLGVAPVARDEFSQRLLPQDVHNLAPSNFADIDPELTEPGLTWGAAKAHVHLRRRREERPVTCAAFVPDLMDQSKVRVALPDCRFIRRPADLAEADETVLLVDLSRPVVFDHLGARPDVVGFGSHVDADLLDRAQAAGCQVVLARSAFFRRLAQCGADPRVLLGDADAGEGE